MLLPSSAAADVTPGPTGVLSTNGWLVVGSVALGLLLAGAVWKVASGRDDDE
jgi:hypothetical protein